jgi:serine/threonine protein kinase
LEKRLPCPTIEPRQLQLVNKIGNKSLGIIFEAHCLGLNLVLKVFQGIKKEVATLACLHHPHVKQLLGMSLDTYQPRCFLLMELMSEDLGAYIVKCMISHNVQRPFNLQVAIDVMLQIVEGMKYLHEQCITHGNFKSSNVLINHVESLEMAKPSYLHVKFANFGLSKTMATSANFSS